jgi:DNA-binding HxlR family transcriptional regulator
MFPMTTHADPVEGWFPLLHWHHGVWVPYIVSRLAERPMRVEELQHAINAGPRAERWPNSRSPRVSTNQLSVTLAGMRRNELVLRSEDRFRVPIAVSYRLSPLIEEFLGQVARPASQWMDAHAQTRDRIGARRRGEHQQSS